MTGQPPIGADGEPEHEPEPEQSDVAPEPGDIVEVEVLTDDARREQIPSADERAAKIEQAKRIAESAAEEAAEDDSDASVDRGRLDTSSLLAGRRRIRRWWHRHLDSADRQEIMADLAVKRDRQWTFRFATMQALSVVVAVMGLSADSAAVVIGAMLLAPLMTPVLGTAACISMALFRRSVRMLGIVLAATVGSIVLAYALAAFVVTSDLPREVTSRTAPDLRDLFVALGAGTAGAYATVRRDVSSSLPGVAVAVALVPPLSVVGIALESGEPTFARGALLLYTTNLVAIVFAGIVVFAVTGFVPPRRLELTFRRSATVAVLVGAVVLVIAIPLVQVSRTAVDRSERQIAAQGIVDDWVAQNGYDARRRPEIEFSDGRILVRIRSFDNAPDARTLIDDLHDRVRFRCAGRRRVGEGRTGRGDDHRRPGPERRRSPRRRDRSGRSHTARSGAGAECPRRRDLSRRQLRPDRRGRGGDGAVIARDRHGPRRRVG